MLEPTKLSSSPEKPAKTFISCFTTFLGHDTYVCNMSSFPFLRSFDQAKRVSRFRLRTRSAISTRSNRELRSCCRQEEIDIRQSGRLGSEHRRSTLHCSSETKTKTILALESTRHAIGRIIREETSQFRKVIM